jgi:predicted alpha/beta hydrolase
VTGPVLERKIDARGWVLAASVFENPGSDTVVLVNAATGVPRQFYKYFADYLRDHGWTTVTWDYRGIGDSAPPSLRGFDVRMRDWALIDMQAIVDWLSSEFGPRRIFSVGHSFGGQGIGLIETPQRISAMVGVSAQSGYWGVQGGFEQYRARFAVTVLIPPASPSNGRAGVGTGITCSATRPCRCSDTRHSTHRYSPTASKTTTGARRAPSTT